MSQSSQKMSKVKNRKAPQYDTSTHTHILHSSKTSDVKVSAVQLGEFVADRVCSPNNHCVGHWFGMMMEDGPFCSRMGWA